MKELAEAMQAKEDLQKQLKESMECQKKAEEKATKLAAKAVELEAKVTELVVQKEEAKEKALMSRSQTGQGSSATEVKPSNFDTLCFCILTYIS